MKDSTAQGTSVVAGMNATSTLRRISQTYTPVNTKSVMEIAAHAKHQNQEAEEEGRSKRRLISFTAITDLISKFLMFIFLPLISLIFIAISVTVDSNKFGTDGISALFYNVLHNPDITTVVSSVQMIGIMCCGELGLVCTTSIIVLQMASTRFTPHVAKLFFADPYVICGLGFYAVVNVYVVWLAFALAGGYNAKYGMLLLIILFTISLALCIPFFVFLFFFVNPKKVIEMIMEEGIRESSQPGNKLINQRQGVSIEAIERLSYFALHALNQQDISLALYSTDALCSTTIVYGETKNNLHSNWHIINDSTRSSSDFFTLSDRAIESLQENKNWFEFKVLKQYQSLFEKSLTTFRALGFRVCVDTREIAESAGRNGDMGCFDLSGKFMNTYIRKAINAKDINMICGCYFQYRQMAEFLLLQRGYLQSKVQLSVEAICSRALHIVKCMRYYAFICIDKDMGFVAKVATYDMSIIVKHSVMANLPCSPAMMDAFITMSARSNINNFTLQGIRQAQVMLATDFLLENAEEYARDLLQCMLEDPVEVLQGVYNDLKFVEEQDFWEVSERNTNIDYISAEQKEKLEIFFAWFPKTKAVGEHSSVTKRMSVASMGLNRSPSNYGLKSGDPNSPINPALKNSKPSLKGAPSFRKDPGNSANSRSEVLEEEDEEVEEEDDEEDLSSQDKNLRASKLVKSTVSSSSSYSIARPVDIGG